MSGAKAAARSCLAAGASGLLAAMTGLGGTDDPERILLALGTGVAPGSDAVATQDAANRTRILSLDFGDVETQLEARASPRHPHHLVAINLGGQLFAIRSGGNGDAGVWVKVVNMIRIDQGVHCGVDGRRSATFSVGAVVEGFHHLVFTIDTGIHIPKGENSIKLENS
jgi:hypothetical protein